MRRILYIVIGFMMLTSCRRNEICYPTNEVGGVAVRITMKWPRASMILPSGFYACFFPGTSAPFVDYLNTYGGVVNLYAGNYSILSFNNDTEVVQFRGTTTFDTFEAYTPEVLRRSAVTKERYEIGVAEPDILFSASTPSFEVYETTDTLVMAKQPVVLIANYPFSFSGIKGVENLSMIRAVIRGVSPSVMLATNVATKPDAQIFLTLRKTADGFRGSFNTFSITWPKQQPVTFEVEFIQGAAVTTYTYEVGEMLRHDGRIDITENLSFDKVSEGGFDTDLGDWKQDDVEIPI